MKKRYFAIVLAVVVVVLPFIRAGSWHYFGFIFCRSSESCIHEVGHSMDFEMGRASKSSEFGEAVLTYLYVQSRYFELDEITDAIQGTGGIFFYSKDYSLFGKRFGCYPQEEMYVNIYTAVGGDVSKLPKILKPFYSEDPKYTDLYNCLMSAKVKLCGRALHMER